MKREFVSEKQLTGKVAYMLLIDNTLQRVPVATIRVDTPYLTGEVKAQCLPDAIYEFIIGIVQGARDPGDPDPMWTEAWVMTRAQAKKTNQLLLFNYRILREYQ